MRYDMRPDRLGWTVFDTATDQAAMLDGMALTGLDEEVADELVDLLNRYDLQQVRTCEHVQC